MKKTIILLIFSFSLLSLLILACTSNTGTSSGNLSSTVHLEGESDHSGIVIGVYELAELDPDIVDANQKWPHIGVIITQHTDFDHRFGALVKKGETDASGNFEINDIPTGVYNVVVIKDGFGFRYIYEVNIGEGNNPLPTSKSNITLYPETFINSDITSPTTWQTDHHYIIEQDITIDDELTIEPGAVVRLNDGITMTIYGNLTAVGQEDNFIWFTSNDNINSYSILRSSSGTLFEYKRIELEGSLDKNISFCKLDHAGIGLYSRINGLDISHCIFRDSQCGFKVEDVDSCFCTNLLCEDIYNEEEGSIYYYQVINGFIDKNILSLCKNGIVLKNLSNPNIENNRIINCELGINISYDSEPIIKHNDIENNITGIYLFADSHSDIIYNNISADYGMILHGCLGNKLLDINYNNLNCNLYAIQYLRWGDHSQENVSGENNYFYSTSEVVINEYIFDLNDVSENQQQYYGEVYYQPFLIQENNTSGIQ